MSSNINKNNILGEYQPYDIKTNTSDNDNSNQPLIFVEHDDSRKQPLFRKSNLSYNPSTNTLNVVNINVSGTGTGVDITDIDTAGTYYITFVDDIGNTKTLNIDKTTTPLSYNPNTGILSAVNLAGNFLVVDATLNNSDFRLTSISNTPSTYNQMLYTDITYNPVSSILKVGKLDNCFALTSSGGNLPILFIDQTATGKQFLYNNSTFYYNPTLGEFLLQGNTTTQNINCNNLTLTSTDAGSSAGPDLILYRNSASPASGDYLGQIQFKGENSNGGEEIYAKITGKIRDETLGTEDGLIETSIKGNGSFVIVSRQRDDELQLLNGCGLSVDGKIEGLNECVIEGDVGLGMPVATNPLVPLHIKGTSAAPSNDGLDGIVQISTNTTQNSDKCCIGVVNGDYSYLQAYKFTTGFGYGNLCLNPAGGNVAISATLSSWNLRVDGDTHLGDDLDNTKYGMLQIVRAGNQGDNKFHQSFVRNGHVVCGMGFLNNSSVFAIQNQANNNTSGAGIFMTGNLVGINTNNPLQALHINGNQQLRNTGGQTVLTLVNNLTGNGWNFFTNYATIYDNIHIQNPVGGGGVYMSPGDTFWRSMSDDRYKHNEVDITNGLDVIMKMKPQFYDRSSKMLDANFNGNLDELGIIYYKESGFIAQDVYEIDELKHIVDVGDEERPWSIQYPQIIAYNTGAIQQLKKEKDELQNKVMELENNLQLIMQHLNLI
jgi:uncharacterized protein YkuJ